MREHDCRFDIEDQQRHDQCNGLPLLVQGGSDVGPRSRLDPLGMKQPQVARLELGEVSPSMDTLMRVASRLGIEFTIDVRPAGAPARNITKSAQTRSAVGSLRTDGAEFLVAAG